MKRILLPILFVTLVAMVGVALTGTLRQGAYDYVIKPFQTDEVLTRVNNIGELQAVEKENRVLRKQVAGSRERRIVGNSQGMKQFLKTIKAVAPDEFNVLPASVQVKLLRVIQEREIEPVGGGGTTPVDFRLICATKADLRDLADQGQFRADLYYRLNVIPLKLPTLAERKEDIPSLVDFFVSQRGGKGSFTLSPERFEALMALSWPGNVRELENVVERMLALPDVAVTELFDTPLRSSADKVDSVGGDMPWVSTEDPSSDTNYRDYMNQCEQRLVRWARAKANNNISVAARILGLPRSTLRSKLDKG